MTTVNTYSLPKIERGFKKKVSTCLTLECNTVNVDIFALYIFSRYSRFSKIDENIYNLKTTCIMP